MANPTTQEKLDFLNRLLHDIQREIEEFERTLKWKKEELAIVQNLRNGFFPCKSCSGKGEILEFRDQDDAHFVQCEKCHGSGIDPRGATK